MSRRGEPVYEERDYSFREERGGAPVRTRERERDSETEIFTSRRGPERGYRPDFLRDDHGRQEPGTLVLRERDTETISRQQLERRPRSPSPVRIRERFVERSEPPPPPSERVRTSTRIVERERRSPSPPPPERLRARVVETRERIRERSPSPVRFRERIIERERERSPSPPPVRIRERERIIERERERTPSPPAIERIRVRNIEREIRQPSPSPSPSPPPVIAPIRAPPIHQEIITHHRHINHGFELAHVPSPPPPQPRREHQTKETDIDIYTSRNNTEVDIRKTTSTSRARTPAPVSRREQFHDDDYLYEQEHNKLRVKDHSLELSRRRSVSARPPPREKSRVRVDIRQDEEEEDFYARRMDERAVMGEAYNGATKDWAIVDVPPGTERVRMDGVGGASEEITWQKYNGVRRSKFIPGGERDRERVEIREEIRDEPKRDMTTSTSLEIDIHTGGGRKRENSTTYERDYERIEEVSDRRVGPPRAAPKSRMDGLWTEVTKDLVDREAIIELGYIYEETEFFYYIIQYLRYEDVLELVSLSESIRHERRQRARQIEREREHFERRDREREEYERRERRRIRDSGYEDERIIEREVIYDNGRRRRDW